MNLRCTCSDNWFCLCLTPNTPNKHIKSLHMAGNQLSSPASVKKERGNWALLAKRQAVTVRKERRVKNAPRNNFRPLPSLQPASSTIQLRVKNVLRYSWMSSVAQGSVSLRQSFSPTISNWIVGAALSLGKEGKKEGVFQWHEPPADNCHSFPPQKPPLTHTTHTSSLA